MAQAAKLQQLAVRLTPAEYKQVEALVSSGLYRSATDFFTEAIRDKLGWKLRS